MSWNRKRVLSGVGTLSVGALLKWGDRLMDIIGLGGAPDDLATWGGWLSNLGGAALMLGGLALLLYGVWPEGGFGLPSFSNDTRMPMRDFRAEAKSRGWDFGDPSLEGMDLADGIRQAALDETFAIWGRPWQGSGFTSVTKNCPLEKVPPEHWKLFSIEIGMFYASDDNFGITTYNSKAQNDWRKGGFTDLHVERRPALRWLRTEANQYKGRRDAEERQRRRG